MGGEVVVEKALAVHEEEREIMEHPAEEKEGAVGVELALP